MNEWIDVNDKLPNLDRIMGERYKYNDANYRYDTCMSSDRVLVSVKEIQINGKEAERSRVTIGRYSNKCGWKIAHGFQTGNKVVAWMPLPKPYE